MSKFKKSHTDKQPPINFLFIGVALITLGIYTNFYDPFNTPKLIILILVASMTFSYLISDYRINGFFVSNLDKLIFLVLIFFAAGLILATVSSNEIYMYLVCDYRLATLITERSEQVILSAANYKSLLVDEFLPS